MGNDIKNPAPGHQPWPLAISRPTGGHSRPDGLGYHVKNGRKSPQTNAQSLTVPRALKSRAVGPCQLPRVVQMVAARKSGFYYFYAKLELRPAFGESGPERGPV